MVRVSWLWIVTSSIHGEGVPRYSSPSVKRAKMEDTVPYLYPIGTEPVLDQVPIACSSLIPENSYLQISCPTTSKSKKKWTNVHVL